MNKDTATALVDALDDLLDRERIALNKGDLAGIGRLMARKTELIDEINRIGRMQHDDLSGLREKAARNHLLMNSALEGIRAVADRMADLRRVRRGLETYDRSGRKKVVATPVQSKVEKRA